jgi:murein DD-endopeptidase MepM/ murein hydrolase activator NlpD
MSFMPLRSVGVACSLLFAPAAIADTCGNADYKGGLDGLRLSRPASGAVASGFGMREHPLLRVQRFHSGLDFAGAMGAPVFAAAKGRVDLAEPKGEYGNFLRIDHGNGLATVYSQLSRFAASLNVGDCVDRGAVIAFVGSTGLSAGPQLHFEVLIDGKHVDPAPLIGGKHP